MILNMWRAAFRSHYDDDKALRKTDFGRHVLHDAEHEDEEDANAAAIFGAQAFGPYEPALAHRT